MDIKSPPDVRDHIAESVTAASHTLPPMVDLRPFMQPVRPQGIEPTCGARIGEAMMEALEKVATGWDGYFSPYYIYNQRPDQTSQGMCLRDVMQILQKNGIVPDAYVEDAQTTITDSMIAEGQKRKIQEYAQVTTLDGVKEALSRKQPCLAGVTVYKDATPYWRKGFTDDNYGNHGLLISYYNDITRELLVLNPQGDTKGVNGYETMSYDDFQCVFECWTAINDSHAKPLKYPWIVNAWWSILRTWPFNLLVK